MADTSAMGPFGARASAGELVRNVRAMKEAPRYVADGDLRARCHTNLSLFELAGSTADSTDRRRSAVVVCIVAGSRGEACLIVTRRAAGLRAHASQYALPGGRVEPGEDAVDAALRETEEEVGLCCKRADVLGLLDDYPTRSGYVITPVVVWGPSGAHPVPNPAEVAAIHLPPLADLDHPDAPRLLAIPESDQPVIQMPLLGQWIHAPTAAILYQFREVALHGRATRVARYEQPTWAWG
ncbi:MAG TPA: CoA pyrophosphatase [Acidimicrobiales bacterium]|nr:CoA pyrophosphatase [Acidimicrobiales bacterium]